jgi:fatty acid synthase subunit alpha, fungi type
MAKQTVDTRFADRDRPRCIERQFLSSQSDEKKIRYEYDPPEPEMHVVSEETAPPVSLETKAPPQQQQPQPVPMASAVPDVPVSALEIVVALVARKLKKSFDEASVVKSIKELCNGKSTLQNELVGILGEEFPTLPAAPEEMPLSLLGETIQPSFSGTLGKESSSTISKMLSSKMSAGLGQSEIKSYLENTWGLGVGRQSSLLLVASTLEPSTRIPSIDAGKEYFDGLVTRYATSCGVSMSKASSTTAPQAAATAVDSGQLDDLRLEQNAYLSKSLNLLSGHLNVESENLAKIAELEPIHDELRTKLDLWTSEFEEEFETGIASCFDTRKERHYDSWWNLVREDVLRLFHCAESGDLSEIDGDFEDGFLHIANRNNSLLRILVEDLTAESLSKAAKYTGFAPVGKKLLALMSTRENLDPVFKFTSGMTAPSTEVTSSGSIEYKEIPRTLCGVSTYPGLLRHGTHDKVSVGRVPFVHVRCNRAGGWQFDQQRTEILLETFDSGFFSGISFTDKNVLLTGAGPASIGAEVLRGLLMGGAKVIITTSRPPGDTKDFYQSLYAEYGARGSELKVLPFNQGNKCDCEALIDYIYSESGLNRTLDAVIPFAAISEEAEIDSLGARSELAHRLSTLFSPIEVQ